MDTKQAESFTIVINVKDYHTSIWFNKDDTWCLGGDDYFHLDMNPRTFKQATLSELWKDLIIPP